jgi:hypothetical protein
MAVRGADWIELGKLLRDARAQVRGHGSALLAGIYDRERNARRGYSDREHLIAAAHWLGRAQDASGDGGVAGRYRLDRGFTSSYPETTGYLVPTFLALGDVLGAPAFTVRAQRAIDFLLPLQLASGAFPGLEIAENRTEPSPFNTAQILCGLVAWHRATGDARAEAAAARAADWLCDIQDDDGAWRRHVYLGVTSTYTAHASCWLAEAGDHFGNARWKRHAGRHLDWVLSHFDPAHDFFDRCGFSEQDHVARRTVTHTLAYTLAGVLHLGRVLGRDDAVDAARRAALRVMRRLHLSHGLPGFLDHRYRRPNDTRRFVCLTGNAQMALVWTTLFAHDEQVARGSGDLRLVNAACLALDGVKDAQPMRNPNPGLRGGIPGSDPLWGDYIRLAVPNWAAKFFIDALLAKRRALESLSDAPPRADLPAESEAPATLPPLPIDPARAPTAPLRIALLTTPRSTKCAAVRAAIEDAAPQHPALRAAVIRIVAAPEAEPPLRSRVLARLARSGLARAPATPGRESPPFPARPATEGAGGGGRDEVTPGRGVSRDEVGPGRDVSRGDDTAPDVQVAAGCGILRAPALAAARLGTLNAHMGILPRYRGMNVAEWAALEGGRVGITVHLVDTGIDTGDLLLVRTVDVAGCDSIAALRARVDAAQLEALAATLAYVAASGELPRRYPQPRDLGRQYFPMHADLKAILERKLARG